MFTSEAAFGEFCGVICHHADREIIASRRNNDTRKGRKEEVWVFGKRLVEAANAEVDEVCVLGIGVYAFDERIVVLLELGNLNFVVVATGSLLVIDRRRKWQDLLLIEITSSWGGITFVLVVGP